VNDQKPHAPQPGTSRAAETAARVAARYATAPTYTQMQAEEARVAVRSAEIATQVAMEAQAAAESALAEMHAASIEQFMRGPATVESISVSSRPGVEDRASEPTREWAQESHAIDSYEIRAESAPRIAASRAATHPPSVVTREVIDGRNFDLRWEPDIPSRAIQMPATPRDQEEFGLALEDWWTPAEVNATLHNEPIEIDGESSHANLIPFPREVVASRKMRPRLAETAAGASFEQEGQLSIFEVDPGTVSTEPVTSQLSEPSTAAWNGPGWSGMELDAHPAREEVLQPQPSQQRGPYLAPLGLRLLAIAVDGSLILAVFSALAMWMASRMAQIPDAKTAEAIVAAGLLVTGFAYHWAFFKMAGTTPGLRYAGIAICTFNNEVPTRLELKHRLKAMALSLLPVGIGMVWAVFDEDHLSWHDRISGTYIRKR
jgi:uncharacterized RDD family membrane protein YckC